MGEKRAAKEAPCSGRRGKRGSWRGWRLRGLLPSLHTLPTSWEGTCVLHARESIALGAALGCPHPRAISWPWNEGSLPDGHGRRWGREAETCPQGCIHHPAHPTLPGREVPQGSPSSPNPALHRARWGHSNKRVWDQTSPAPTPVPRPQSGSRAAPDIARTLQAQLLRRPPRRGQVLGAAASRTPPRRAEGWLPAPQAARRLPQQAAEAG